MAMVVTSSLCGSGTVNAPVAIVADGDQVIFRIGSRMAAEVEMVNFKVSSPAAELAAPAIAFHNAAAKGVVGGTVNP